MAKKISAEKDGSKGSVGRWRASPIKMKAKEVAMFRGGGFPSGCIYSYIW